MTIRSLAAGLLVLAIAATSYLLTTGTAAACPEEAIRDQLAQPGGEAVLAGLPDECLVELIEEMGPDIAPLAVAAGRAALLFGRLDDDLVLRLLEAEVHDGTRVSFFMDADLVEALSALDGRYLDRASALHDLALAARPNSSVSEARDEAAYWSARPASMMSAQQLDDYCRNRACTELPTDCNATEPALKYLAATDSTTLWEVLSDCQVSADFVLSLRRQGVLDGLCSAGAQVDAARRFGLGPEIDCGRVLVSWPVSSFASSDLFAYLALHMNQAGLDADQHDQNADVILRFFPSLDPELLDTE